MSFGDTETNTFVAGPIPHLGWKADLYRIKVKKRRRVQHPAREPSAVLEKQARESASQLAQLLGVDTGTAAASKSWCPKRLLVDSGSGDHLSSRKSTPKSVVKRTRNTGNPLVLFTANALISVDGAFDYFHPRLQKRIESLLLEDTPDVLSIGKLVEEEGIDFVWAHGHQQ